MDMNPDVQKYYYHHEDPIINTTQLPLQVLFPEPNNGIIRPNCYYPYDGVHRYLLMQSIDVIDALKNRFQGGVYFLRDRSRNLIKIGCSKALGDRIFQLINGAKTYALDSYLELIGIHPASPNLILRLEKHYHDLFQEYAYKYEWFKLPLEKFQSVIKESCPGFSVLVKTFAHDEYLFIYSDADIPAEEIAPAIDFYPFRRSIVQEMLCFNLLERHKLTILVQDHKGHIIPFGWRQDDIDFLNTQDIWESQHLICLQKLRILAMNSQHVQNSFFRHTIWGR